NLHLNQKLGYSPKNTKCFINVPNSKSVNVSLLCAIDKQGIVALNIKVGSFKSVDILSFIQTELPVQDSNLQKYIIMDNASIHKTSDVREALAAKRYILLFFAALNSPT
ncbi:hypothetical protein DMUE_5467, partial [Dictyocoela muelleri]